MVLCPAEECLPWEKVGPRPRRENLGNYERDSLRRRCRGQAEPDNRSPTGYQLPASPHGLPHTGLLPLTGPSPASGPELTAVLSALRPHPHLFTSGKLLGRTKYKGSKLNFSPFQVFPVCFSYVTYKLL